jgi:hypothetical protein
MPVRFLSDAELARLSSWPDEIAEHDQVTFFALTSDDAAWLSGQVRVENRLGAAVQLCTLPWLGWIPDDLTGCPSAAVNRLGAQLELAPDDLPELLASYGGWEGRTRRDHRALVLTRLGWRACGTGDRKQLDAFLLARALEHDAPGVLLQLACDWLRHERIKRPSMNTPRAAPSFRRDPAALDSGRHAGGYVRSARCGLALLYELGWCLCLVRDLALVSTRFVRREELVSFLFVNSTPDAKRFLKCQRVVEALRNHGAFGTDSLCLPFTLTATVATFAVGEGAVPRQPADSCHAQASACRKIGGCAVADRLR